MWNIKRLMFGTILWVGSMIINQANADTLQPCSCWTTGNSRAMGSKCYAKAQFQASTLETLFTLVWLPADCLSWCNAAWTQEKINTYVFPYYDGTSWNSCDGDAIYDKDNFINRIVRESSASEKKGRTDKIKTYLKSHPNASHATPSPTSSKSAPAHAAPAKSAPSNAAPTHSTHKF